MRTYDTYKDSGISWLGQIPSHWDVKRARIVLAENASVNSDVSVTKQLQFKYGEIEPKANQSVDDGVKETISKYTVVDKGDIMINGLNLNYDFISQRVALVQEKGCITSAYVSLRPTKLANSRYYTYYLKAMDNIKMFHGMGSGVRLTLSYKELKNMYIPIPPIEEQRVMADYIDKATAEIDKAIASQQRMVELLQERKQIIINQAVTQGLNPDAPMKPTNIDRIKRVPKHWDVCAFKRNIKINNGRDYKDYIDEKVYPVIGSGGCFDYCSRYLYDGEALLLGRKGTINKPMYINGKFWTVDTMFYAIPSKQLNCKFAYFMALTFPFEYYSTQTALPSMTQSDLGSIKVALPPYSEQIEIVNYIESSIKPVDEAISRCEQKIALLTERKQILINDIVTGKMNIK